jgi:hypothetical protein
MWDVEERANVPVNWLAMERSGIASPGSTGGYVAIS